MNRACCTSCFSQWERTRYGWSLSPHTVFGAMPSFTCPDCKARRRV